MSGGLVLGGERWGGTAGRGWATVWAPALSLLLHGAALAAVLLLLHRPRPPAPAAERGVEIVWEQSAEEDSLVTGETSTTAQPAAPPEVTPPPLPEDVPPPPAPPVAVAPSPPLAAPPPVPRPSAPVPIEALLPPPEPPAEPPPPSGLAALLPPPPPAPVLPPVTLPSPPAPAEAPAPEELPEEARALPMPPPPMPSPPPRPAPPRQVAAAAAAPASPQAQPQPSAPWGPGPQPLVLGGSRVTGAVTPPGLLDGHRNPEPEYPSASRQRGEQGVVTVRLRVSEAGEVAEVEILSTSGYPALDEAARRAVLRWRFRPAMRDGAPVPGDIRTAIHFRLR